MNKQLLILGNGFDLACGLKSSYKDFYIAYIKDNVSVSFGFNQIQTTPGRPYGFWEQLLTVYSQDASSDDYNWCDIEEIIKKELININFSTGQSGAMHQVSAIKDLAWFIFKKVRTKAVVNEAEAILFECVRLTDLCKVRQFITNFCAQFYSSQHSNKEPNNEQNVPLYLQKELNRRLLRELKHLEIRFCNYLYHNIENPKQKNQINEDYIVNSINLLNKLIEFKTDDGKRLNLVKSINEFVSILRTNHKLVYRMQNVDVLCFNYTNPFWFVENIFGEKTFVWNNIHGGFCYQTDKCNACQGSSVVFGIDDNVIKEKDETNPLRIFSKTYRTLLMTENEHLEVLPELDENENNFLEIKVFGHSLNAADYSYFHSIFDNYNIYSNKRVSLKFYYSPKYPIAHNVYKLMNKYGKTLSNEDQGRNMMHKLILEKRIKIIAT